MEMKMIWVLVTISLALAEKLDRTYLPPPGSPHSGGSPGAIKVPLELQNNNHSSYNKGLPKSPELVIGINRVGPIPAGYTFEDIISTPEPKIIYNGNYSTSPRNTTSAFKQSSPFLKVKEDYTPEFNYNSGHFINEFDPSMLTFHDKNRVYLPSYGGNNTDDVPFITLPPPFNSGMSISNVNTYIQPVIGSNEDTSNDQQSNSISTTSSINNNSINANINIVSSPSITSQFSATTPISTIKERPSIYNTVTNQQPERVQAQADRQAVILNYEQTITPEGYAYSYVTSNGIHGNEEGTAINGVKAKGSYSYIGDDGNFYQVEYTADKNGFVPKGSHLPTAPPVPDAILKVIEQAAKDKEAGIYDDGSYNEDKYGYKKYQKIYPQINNIVNGADFLPDNEINIKKDNYFHEFEDSYEDNGSENAGESPENKLGDIDPVRSNYYSVYDIKNYTSPTNIVVSQSYQNQKPLSKSGLDMPTSDNISDKTNLHTASGYEYFAPRTSFYEAKPFPTRFSATENRDVEPETYENNTDIMTAKPFLTPYVTRKYDNSENNDYDEENGTEYKDMGYDAQPSRNRTEENYRDDLYDKDNQLRLNDKAMSTELGIDSRDLLDVTPGNKLGQRLEYGDRIQNVNDLVPFDKKGNFYENPNNPFITLNQRVSYTTSIPAPTDFPTSISILDTNTTSGRGSTSFQAPTLSSVTTLIDSSTKLSVTTLPTYATSPVTLDTELPAVNPETFSKTDLISTTRDLQTLRPIPTRFGMPYRLTTESSDIKYNGQTSTENIIGEDFTGPKQSQRFDPVSGYYY